MKKRAQISMEYLTIVGFVAVIILPLLIIYTNYSGSTEDQIISNQVGNIAKKVGDTAESVYYLGEPSKTQVRTYFPKNINNITVSGREIVFFVKSKNGIDEVVVNMPVNVTGSLSSSAGIHNIVIESKGSYVLISD